MATILVDYHGLLIPDPDPTGAAGLALKENFVAIADEFSALYDALGTKAGVNALTAHTSDTDNPHEVSAEQVGAYTTSAVDALLDDKADASDLSAHLVAADPHGDRAYADGILSGHTGNKNNPHEVTAEQVGAAPASHTHSASDINSGTLDAARIPNLSASKINAGTLDIARIPTGVTSNTVAIGSHTHSLADLSDVFTGAGALHQDLLAYAGAGVGWMPLSASDLGLASATQISTAISNHAGAADPHGDRAYADSLFASLIPKGHISGLTVSNNAADPDNDLDIAAGEAVDESRSYLMRLSTPITKRLDAAWSVGTGNGGLFSGTKQPNTWYHVFLIRRDSDGMIDVGFDTSPNAANKPVGWSSYRQIGSRLTDGSGNLKRILQIGERQYHSEAQVDHAAITPAAGWHTYTLSAPPVAGTRAIIGCIITDPTANPIVSWRPTGSTDSDGIYIARGIPGAQFRVSATVETDANSQVDIRCSVDFTPDGNLYLTTNGWIDTRGRR